MAYKSKTPTMIPCFGNHFQLGCPNCQDTHLVVDPKERLCNQCGNALQDVVDQNEFQSDYGLRDVKVEAGYFSNYLIDCNEYTFSLCEKCIRDLFIGFKIKPDIACNIDSSEYSWEDEQATIEERLWRQSSGPIEKYKQQICNEKQHCEQQAIHTLFYVDDNGDIFSNKCICNDHAEYYEKRPSYKLVPFINHKLLVFI